MNKKTIKIIFIGTAEFAAVILKVLVRDDWPIKLVITQPDKPIGRKQILTPPPVKKEALKYNLTILQPAKISEGFSQIKKIAPDLIIVAAYGQIIPEKILDLATYGSLNIHASLLPKYRGASPIQEAILTGDEKTGVTIILMDEKMDHGPILVQQKLEFPISNFQFPILSQKLSELGADLLIKTLPKFIGGEIEPRPQDETKATYTKILTKNSGKIDWQKKAEIIERQIRAFYPWPGSWTEFSFPPKADSPLAKKVKSQRLKILKVKILETEKPNIEIGKLFLTENKQLAVTCGQGSLILDRVQLEGKKETSGADFARGYREMQRLN